MQVMIDIDENVFTRLFDNGIEDYAITNDDLYAIAKSIRLCTPIPKGHGRLIDADALNRKDINCANVPMNFIDTAPTIIERDNS